MKKSSGLVQIVALIVVFVIIVLYFGKSPLGIWNDTVKPLVVGAFDLIVRGIEFLIRFVTEAWQRR